MVTLTNNNKLNKIKYKLNDINQEVYYVIIAYNTNST